MKLRRKFLKTASLRLSSPAPCGRFPKICCPSVYREPSVLCRLFYSIWFGAVIYISLELAVGTVWLLFIPLLVYLLFNLAYILGNDVPRSVGARTWHGWRQIAMARNVTPAAFLVSSECFDFIMETKLVSVRWEGTVWHCAADVNFVALLLGLSENLICFNKVTFATVLWFNFDFFPGFLFPQWHHKVHFFILLVFLNANVFPMFWLFWELGLVCKIGLF